MKSYKFRIYPSKIQDEEMQKHLWFSRELWNKLHKLSHQLVNPYSLIALEELASQDMAEQNYGKQIGDAGWGMFANMLSYKAEKVVFVNPKDTTKTCHKCRNKQDMTLKECVYDCEQCGMSEDRDINAAINILIRATEGTSGSNACEDGAIAPSVKQEAITLPIGGLG